MFDPIGKYGVDTMKCEEHLSIYTEFYKQKSYDSAFDSWFYLFTNAPKRTKNLYIHGATLYKNFIKNESDSLLREDLIDGLLKIYDHRNYYYPGQEGLVLGYKGSDLYRSCMGFQLLFLTPHIKFGLKYIPLIFYPLIH